MLNHNLIKTKIEYIQRDIGRLKEYSRLSFDAVAKDWHSYSVVKLLLMEIIGRAIDINQHIIAETASTQVAAPLDYRQTFIKLGELKVLPQEFSEEIAQSAGFRNAVVHGYNDLDQQVVYKSIADALNQYTQYTQHILDFLGQSKWLTESRGENN